MSGPAYHARTHLPGGTDPIQSGSAGVFTTYKDCVAADPTTVSLWPMDDPSGNLRNIVGADDLTVTADQGWPHYQSGGPFTGLPAQTAVENGGGNVSSSLASQSRFTFGGTMPSGTDPFTLQGWLYWQNDAANRSGTIWNSSQVYMDVANTGVMSIARGAGGGVVHLTGAVLPLGAWSHIRIDYDGSTLRLFQDFVLLDTDTQGSIAGGGSVSFLNEKPPAVNWFPFVGRAALWSLHDGVASTCVPTGAGGGPDAPEDYGMWADGAGGVSWHLVQPDNIEAAAVGPDALASSSVVAGKIAAGTIVNADVSATADIVVTKLAEGTDGQTLKTVGTTPTWTTVTPPDPADDTHVWMPLTSVVAGDPVLVWDGTDSLIPTLTPI